MFGHKKTFWNTEYKRFAKEFTDPVMHNNRIFTEKVMMSLDRKRTRRNGNTFLLTNDRDANHWLYANILQANSSYVIPDADGEIYQSTQQYLRDHGYKIHVINIGNPDAGTHYDPLACLQQHGSTYQESIQDMISVIVHNHWSRDPFMRKTQATVIQTVLHYIKTLPKEQQTWDMFFKLLPKPQEDKRAPWDGGIMKHSSDDFVLQGLDILSHIPSIMLIEALTEIPTLYNLQAVVRTTDALDMIQFAAGKHAIYLVYKSNVSWHKDIISLFYAQLLDTLYSLAECTKERKLETPWLFYANQWQLNLTVKLATCSKYNIFFVVQCSSLLRFQYIYPHEWEDIITSCDVILYAPSVGCNAHEYITKLMKYTGKPGQDNSAAAAKALMAVSPSQCIIFVRGIMPFCCEKYKWTQHPNAIEMSKSHH